MSDGLRDPDEYSDHQKSLHLKSLAAEAEVRGDDPFTPSSHSIEDDTERATREEFEESIGFSSY